MFGLRELAAMGIIFTGVALVKRFSHPGKLLRRLRNRLSLRTG